MALDPGWAAIGGAVVGSLGTVAVRLLDRLIGRADAQTAVEREDHIRDLDRRREIYTACIGAAHRCMDAIGEMEMPLDIRREDMGDHLLKCFFDVDRLSADLDLAAPASVREAYQRLVEQLRSAVGRARLELYKETTRPRGSTFQQTLDVGVSRKAFVTAIRADLRIREPEVKPPRVAAGRGLLLRRR